MAASLWIGVSTLWVSTFLYGIYLSVFYRCIRIFLTRGRLSRSQIILLTGAIVMFALSTASVVVFLLQGATAYGSLRLPLPSLQTAGAIVYVTNNVFADALLIYRCYVIWNTVWITVAPVLLLIATMLTGYAIQLKLFFILSLTTNLFVPTLVAGRLWWIIRRIRGSAGESTRRKARKAMSIILESGLIYSVVVSIHMGFFHYQDPMDEIVYAALSQIVGIVPTLIIVRVGRGVSEDGDGDGGDRACGHASAHHGDATLVGSARGPGSIKRAPSDARSNWTRFDEPEGARPVPDAPARAQGEKSAWDSETLV